LTSGTAFTAQYHDTVTEPIYLIELGFSPVLYLSSSKDLLWNGQYWKSAPVEVSTIDHTAVGGQAVSLSFANHDRTFGALVLSQVAQDRLVKVWEAYDNAGTLNPVLFADGVMDGAEIGEQVTLNVISKSTAYGSTPRILCGPPLMNHLPPSGTVLKAGSVTITIRSR
jgi:hypothetical protein